MNSATIILKTHKHLLYVGESKKEEFLTYKLVNNWKERTHADTFKTHE